MNEIDRKNAAGLRSKELLPRRASAAGRGADSGGVQDLRHSGGGDQVAELDQFALYAPVPPRWVVRSDADHELADCGCRRRPAGGPSAGVVPFTCDQPPVPDEPCRRGNRERLAPLSAGDQPRQWGEPQPVARLVADAADLAAQDRALVPQDQELGILGHLTPGQHHEAAEQAAHKQVDSREDHSGAISPRKTPPATPDRVIEPYRITDGLLSAISDRLTAVQPERRGAIMPTGRWSTVLPRRSADGRGARSLGGGGTLEHSS